MDYWKSLPKQTHLVENGEIGDCWRCCIAAVLGLPFDAVPHFLQGKGGVNGSVDADTQDWLHHRGYLLACVESRGSERETIQFPRWGRSDIQLPAVISCGPTERSRGLGRHHAVVTIGHEMVYDPHPSEAGLTAIVEQWLVFPESKPIPLRMSEIMRAAAIDELRQPTPTHSGEE